MKDTLKLPNFHKVKCCGNCHYSFSNDDYDSPGSLFCTFDAKKRPICGSVGLKECFDDDGKTSEEEYSRKEVQWREWAEENEVPDFYVCDNWTEKDQLPRPKS